MTYEFRKVSTRYETTSFWYLALLQTVWLNIQSVDIIKEYNHAKYQGNWCETDVIVSHARFQRTRPTSTQSCVSYLVLGLVT